MLRAKRITAIFIAAIMVGALFSTLNVEKASAASAALKAPSTLKAVSAGKRTIKLYWSKSANAKGYLVYRYNASKGKYTLIKKTSKLYFVNKNLKKNKIRSYKVRAYGYVNGAKKYSGYTYTVKAKPTRTSSKYKRNVRKIYLNVTSKKIYKGNTFKIKAKLSPSSKLVSYTKYWWSSNKNIATVNSYGKVTAKKPGTCYIYVRSHNGIKRSIKITVKVKPTPVDPDAVIDIEEHPNYYLPYGDATIWIGQTWNDSVNASLNSACGGSGAIPYSVLRDNSWLEKNLYIYQYDTTDFSDYLIVYVCGQKIVGWNTTSDVMGVFDDTVITANTHEDNYNYLGAGQDGTEGICVDTPITEAMTGDPYYEQGSLILGGICDIDGRQEIMTSIYQEERFAENIINALRVKHELNILTHNELLYDPSGTYGTLAGALTMAQSEVCSHAKGLTKGPLANMIEEERDDFLRESTNKTLCIHDENVSAGYGTAEPLVRGQYTSPGHKQALLGTYGNAFYHPPTEIAVAGAIGANGVTYWEFQSAGLRKEGR